MTEKEINLQVYKKILLKRLWLIILVPVVSLSVTAILIPSFRKTESNIYEADIIIENGFLNEPLIKITTSFEKIKSRKLLEDVADKFCIKDRDRFITNLSSEIQTEDIEDDLRFKLIIEGSNPDFVKKVCILLAKLYIKEENENYKKQKQVYLDKLELLNISKKLLEDSMLIAEDIISGLKKQKEYKGDKEYKGTEGNKGNIINIRNIRKIDSRDDKDDKYNKNHSELFDRKLKVADAILSLISVTDNIDSINSILANAKEFRFIEESVICKEICDNGEKSKLRLLVSGVMGLLGGVVLALIMGEIKLS